MTLCQNEDEWGNADPRDDWLCALILTCRVPAQTERRAVT
jgi:hypothetical protein